MLLNVKKQVLNAIKFLYKLNEERYAKKTDISSVDLIGTTDISTIGDGSITGAIQDNSEKIVKSNNSINEINTKLNAMTYTKTINVFGRDRFTFKSIMSTDNPFGLRQSVLLFGSANSQAALGILTIYDSRSEVNWSGISGDTTVTASLAGNTVTVVFGLTCYDKFIIMSADRID